MEKLALICDNFVSNHTTISLQELAIIESSQNYQKSYQNINASNNFFLNFLLPGCTLIKKFEYRLKVSSKRHVSQILRATWNGVKEDRNRRDEIITFIFLSHDPIYNVALIHTKKPRFNPILKLSNLSSSIPIFRLRIPECNANDE